MTRRDAQDKDWYPNQGGFFNVDRLGEYGKLPTLRPAVDLQDIQGQGSLHQCQVPRLFQVLETRARLRGPENSVGFF
jgi:hypothetical protein